MLRSLVALVAVTALVVPASAQLSRQDSILPICDKALVAAMTGGDPVAVLDEATRTMSAQERQRVGAVCALYLVGAAAFARHAREAAKLPAGGIAI